MYLKHKFIRVNGFHHHLSPLILSGSLIAAGVAFNKAYDLATKIIDQAPDDGMHEDEFFQLIVSQLESEQKTRYISLKLTRRYLTSEKSRSPLFIFLGGLAGKTTIASYITQQLNMNQPISIDNEKYGLTLKPSESSQLYKSTYESAYLYKKISQLLTPRLIGLLDRVLFDYKRYKKWCYLWEGIYITAPIITDLYKKYGQTHFLSVFIIPETADLRRSYILRWQKELGVERLRKRRNIIDKFLRNIEAIRSHIRSGVDPVASFVIESPYLEERLEFFYILLQQKLKDISDKEFPGWVEKIVDNPKNIKKFKQFLKGA